MPIFELETGGKTFEIEAADHAAAIGAIEKLTAAEGKPWKAQPGGVPAPVETPNPVADVAKSAGIGAVKGTIGLANIPHAINAGLNWGNAQLAERFPDVVQRRDNAPLPIPTGADIQKGIEGYTGEFYAPQTTAGQLAEKVGEFAPAALAGPGGLATRIATQAVAPALASEGAGYLTKGTKYETPARLAAALIAGPAASRIVTPLPAGVARNAMVDSLEAEGVTGLTAGQRTGSKTLQYAESILGDASGAGGRAQAAQEAAANQFTQAATRRAGFEGAAIPENLAANKKRLGQEFERLSQNNAVVPDQQFVSDVVKTARQYANTVLPSQRAGGARDIQTIVQDISNEMQAAGGVLPGPLYQAARSRLSNQALAAEKTDTQLASALRGIRDALDDAMARSMSTADAEAYSLARRQYGAQKVVEKTAARAGQASAEGVVTPAALRGAVTSGGNNASRYARGEGQFADLARSGNAIMSPLPNSGTGQRNAISGIAALMGGGAGAFLGGAQEMSLAAIGGLAAPAVAGRALMSRPVQGYLGNQVLPASTANERALRALLQASSAALVGR